MYGGEIGGREFGAPPPFFTPPLNPYNPTYVPSREVGSREDPLKNWSKPMKDALEKHQDGGFPFQLSLTTQTKPQMLIPAVYFSEKIQSSIGDVLNKELKIYVSPTEFFTAKFRKIFTKTQIKFTTSEYARKWLGGHNMSFCHSS